jgi:uncharacterized protein HemX
LLGRLSRQITHLKPGYQSRPVAEDGFGEKIVAEGTEDTRSYDEKLVDFFKSLVTIKNSEPQQSATQQTVIVDVAEKLEQNLKLTRWSVLERNAYQYDRLMKENVELFEQYYDLQDAANADFHDSLMQLRKASLKPDLPDISGSLRLLKQIEQQRENSPQETADQEADNG